VYVCLPVLHSAPNINTWGAETRNTAVTGGQDITIVKIVSFDVARQIDHSLRRQLYCKVPSVCRNSKQMLANCSLRNVIQLDCRHSYVSLYCSHLQLTDGQRWESYLTVLLTPVSFTQHISSRMNARLSVFSPHCMLSGVRMKMWWLSRNTLTISINTDWARTIEPTSSFH
jgi:hypothetical protein